VWAWLWLVIVRVLTVVVSDSAICTNVVIRLSRSAAADCWMSSINFWELWAVEVVVSEPHWCVAAAEAVTPK
jgi:hypothetical protein